MTGCECEEALCASGQGPFFIAVLRPSKVKLDPIMSF